MKTVLILISLIFTLSKSYALELNQKAPEFSLPSLTNTAKKIQSSDYKGLVVYVDFWASWCAPCAKTFPELNKIYQEFQPYGFEVIAISVDDNIKDAHKFLKKYPADFLVAHDLNGATAEEYNLPGMPVGYLINSNGNVKKITLGMKTQKDVDELVTMIKKELGIL